MGVPLYVICHVSPVSFNILSLTFIILITVSLGVLLLGFILPGTLCASWTWLNVSFGAFNPFTFKVIIDMYNPITIFLIVLGLFSVGGAFPSLVFCLEKFP